MATGIACDCGRGPAAWRTDPSSQEVRHHLKHYPPYIEADFTSPDFYHVRLRPESEGLADVVSATAAAVDRALAHSPIRSCDASAGRLSIVKRI